MARTNARALPISELFVRGRYQDVLEQTVDCRDGALEPRDAGYVVASLASSGRLDEAEAMLAVLERGRDRSAVSVGRFFVGVALCRAGRFAQADSLFRRNVALCRRDPDPLLRFHAWQGLACLRYFSGRIARSATLSHHALRWAFAAGSSFGRLLATDLHGHALVAMGRVKAGLSLLRRAAALAETLSFEGHQAAIRIAIATYEARFGGRPPLEAIAALEEAQRAHVHDSYSVRHLMLDRAALLAFMGRADEAWSLLQEADRLVIPDGDERMAVRLAITTALVASLRDGATAAAHHLADAEARLQHHWDRALRVEVLCARAWTALPEDRDALARALEDAFRETGVARAAVFARLLSPGAPSPSSVRVRDFEDDRLGALLLALGDPTAVPRLLRDGYLGLFPRALGLPPGRRLYFVGGSTLLVERHGNVTLSRPGEGTLRLLRTLGDNRWWTKEALLATGWSIAVYRPDRHDSVVYMAVTRARQALGECREWLENDQGSYRLAAVECRTLDAETRVLAPEPGPDRGEPVAPEPAADREGALVFLRAHGSVSTGALAKALGVSEMTALRLVRALVDDGVLRRVGRGRATRYELAEQVPRARPEE